MKIFNSTNKIDASTPRLIKYYETTANDATGFYINDVTIQKGHAYKFICQGSFSDSVANAMNLCLKFDNISPSTCRTAVTGYELGSQINTFSTVDYFRVLRGRWGYGCLAETIIYWRNSTYISALGNYSCMGTDINGCINSQICTLLGPYSGDSFTSLHFYLSSSSATINTGLKISIYEFPLTN